MKTRLIAGMLTLSLLGAFSMKADAKPPKRRSNYSGGSSMINDMWNPNAYSNTWSPNYGYSTGYGGMGNHYGNSAPYQGNFRFMPGFGYGSIYGNHGHPGFHNYTGPSWGY